MIKKEFSLTTIKKEEGKVVTDFSEVTKLSLQKKEESKEILTSLLELKLKDLDSDFEQMPVFEKGESHD